MHTVSYKRPSGKWNRTHRIRAREHGENKSPHIYGSLLHAAPQTTVGNIMGNKAFGEVAPKGIFRHQTAALELPTI